jgi:hypothetical protein
MTTMDKVLAQFPSPAHAPLIAKFDIETGERELFAEDHAWLTRFPRVIIELHDWALPGQRISRNFLRAITSYDFDFMYAGENILCFNNALLTAERPY